MLRKAEHLSIRLCIVILSMTCISDLVCAFPHMLLMIRPNGSTALPTDSPLANWRFEDTSAPTMFAKVGSTFTMTLPPPDPSWDNLTYSCSSGCPSGLTVNPSTGVVTWTPATSHAGYINNVIFRVSNNTLMATKATTFKVYGPNLADISKQAAFPGSPFSYNLNGLSPVSAPLTYSCSGGCPSWLYVNAISGEMSGIPSTVDAGQAYTVTLSVSDGEVSASKTMQLVVASTVACGLNVTTNCYSGSDAASLQAIGAVTTPAGKKLVWFNNAVWQEHNGTRILKVDGTDDWAKGLDMTGRTRTAVVLNKTIANISGRVCPPSVFVPAGDPDAGLTASGKCVYYDSGNLDDRLDSPKYDFTTNQTSPGEIRLGDWDSPAGGNGTGASWYEGNIQVCAAKGMRLPTLYETTAANPGGVMPTDASPSPTFASASTGVPGGGYGYTVTATAYPAWIYAADVYWTWAVEMGTMYFYRYTSRPSRCVVP